MFLVPSFADLDVVKEDALLLSIWRIESFFELVHVFLGTAMLISIRKVLSKSGVLGRNFIRILYYISSFFYISILARLYLILFEMDWIYGWEADYEQNDRGRYFMILLIVGASLALLAVLIGMFLIAIYPFFCNTMAAVIFALVQIGTLLKYYQIHTTNSRAMKWLEELKAGKGLKTIPPAELTRYNLSVRFQTKEILRVIQLLRKMILCVATMQVFGVGFGYLVIGYQSPDFLLQFIKLTYSYFLTMVASSLVPAIVCMVPEWREGLSQILSLNIVGIYMFYGIKIGNETYEFFQPTFADLAVVKDNSVLLTIWEAEAILEATLAIFDIVMASALTNLLADSGVLSRNFIGTLHYMNFWVVVSLVARCYLLLFEADQLYGWETPLIHPIAVLILAWLRLMLIGAGGFVPQLICIERLFATFFIADYEKNGRSFYFNGVLAVNACAASVVILGGMFLLAAHPELCTIASAVLFFTIQIGTILLYFVLQSQNQHAWLWLEEQKARKGSSKPPLGLTHYGLSVRFQVKENLRVIKLLRRMVLFSFSLCMIGVTFGYSVLADRRGTVFIQTLALTYNLYLTIATSLMVPGLVAIVPEWRAQMIQAWIGLFRCRKSAARAPILAHKAPSVDTKLETQAYWRYYKSEW